MKLNLEAYFIVQKLQLKPFQNQTKSREYGYCPESLTKPTLKAKQYQRIALLSSNTTETNLTTKLGLENYPIVKKPQLKLLQNQSKSTELSYCQEIATKTTSQPNYL